MTGRHPLRKMFPLVLENIFKDLQWDNKEVNMDSGLINILRFANDIVLIE